MGSPGVAQLQFLRDIFCGLLTDLAPRAIAVLGCTTGNGFECIDPSVTRRILAIDINPTYLRIASDRFGRHLPRLESLCADISSQDLPATSFDLVHCALVLEYVDPEVVVPKAAAAVRQGGTLAVVLQLASPEGSKVSPTPYTSLWRLESIIRLVDPPTLGRIATAAGLREVQSDTRILTSGKSFWVGRFLKLGKVNRTRAQ